MSDDCVRVEWLVMIVCWVVSNECTWVSSGEEWVCNCWVMSNDCVLSGEERVMSDRNYWLVSGWVLSVRECCALSAREYWVLDDENWVRVSVECDWMLGVECAWVLSVRWWEMSVRWWELSARECWVVNVIKCWRLSVRESRVWSIVEWREWCVELRAWLLSFECVNFLPVLNAEFWVCEISACSECWVWSRAEG